MQLKKNEADSLIMYLKKNTPANVTNGHFICCTTL